MIDPQITVTLEWDGTTLVFLTLSALVHRALGAMNVGHESGVMITLGGEPVTNPAGGRSL